MLACLQQFAVQIQHGERQQGQRHEFERRSNLRVGVHRCSDPIGSKVSASRHRAATQSGGAHPHTVHGRQRLTVSRGVAGGSKFQHASVHAYATEDAGDEGEGQ